MGRQQSEGGPRNKGLSTSDRSYQMGDTESRGPAPTTTTNNVEELEMTTLGVWNGGGESNTREAFDAWLGGETVVSEDPDPLPPEQIGFFTKDLNTFIIGSFAHRPRLPVLFVG
jgi:hypothetical protein